MKRFGKEGAILILLIIGCAVAARYASRGDTLSEYAVKNGMTVSGNDISGNSR